MNYVLVKNINSETPEILLGPSLYRQRFFQSELEDLGINYSLPASDPGFLFITNELHLVPVEEEYVQYNADYDDLAGPFYRFENNIAYMHYDVMAKPLDAVKAIYKNKVANLRYYKENSGTVYNLNGVEVNLATSREYRFQFANIATSMNETDTVNWKFNVGFIDLTLQDVNNINIVINTYVQSQFNWEKSKYDEIDACTTIEQLKLLDLN